MKTAIIYASQHGTTKYCAALLAKLLPDAVAIDVTEAPALEAYDCVVLGTAIYAGRGMHEMAQWCSAHLDSLQQRRLGLFICCMNTNDETVQRQLRKAFPNELQQHAVVRASFGGALTMSRLTLPEKAMMRLLGYTQDQTTVNAATIEQFAADLSA
ncbi:MAG: flavodoxin domain-containing protein [Candidatus Saccharibacteria bacterium]|nr:flavodoxin domain-containing protein [Candidatus Saccharibacteria bacterium]